MANLGPNGEPGGANWWPPADLLPPDDAERNGRLRVRRGRWFAVAVVYFALSITCMPDESHASGAVPAGGFPGLTRMGELGALGLGILGMFLLVHGIFATHPGRNPRPSSAIGKLRLFRLS